MDFSEAIDLVWDAKSTAILRNFMRFDYFFTDFKVELTQKLGEEARDHIKPMTVGRSSYYTGGHNLERSINYHGMIDGKGFEITFSGLFYGNYMDEGNFEPWGVLMATSYGMPFFPVGKNRNPAGPIYYMEEIHGMGHTTPGVPTHFSEKTAQWLGDNMYEFTDQYVGDLFRKLVDA